MKKCNLSVTLCNPLCNTKNAVLTYVKAVFYTIVTGLQVTLYNINKKKSCVYNKGHQIFFQKKNKNSVTGYTFRVNSVFKHTTIRFLSVTPCVTPVTLRVTLLFSIIIYGNILYRSLVYRFSRVL